MNGNIAFSFTVLSIKKRFFSFLKKGFSFSENVFQSYSIESVQYIQLFGSSGSQIFFKVCALKNFVNFKRNVADLRDDSGYYHIKICRSFKQRVVLKIPRTFF